MGVDPEMLNILEEIGCNAWRYKNRRPRFVLSWAVCFCHKHKQNICVMVILKAKKGEHGNIDDMLFMFMQ